MEKPMRLDKYLASFTELSRKEAKAMIRKGLITIDGQRVVREEEKVGEKQEVALEGKVVQAEKFVYYMLNKPSGVVSATTDAREKTVVDIVEADGRKLFPVGRLDKDTEGLLILTDDGALSHTLLSPRYHVEKTYEIHYEGELMPDAVADMQKGVDIGEKKLTKPASLELPEPGKALLTISEGKYHQVKRMIAKEGGKVVYLKRIRMGGIRLDDTLMPGEYRRLTAEEICQLRKAGRKE